MSFIGSGSRTPTQPPADHASSTQPASPRATTAAGDPSPTRRRSASPPADPSHERQHASAPSSESTDRQDRSEREAPRGRPTLSQPVPAAPARATGTSRRSVQEPASRRASTSQHERPTMAQSQNVRAIQSEPAISELHPAPKPTEYQEHFYQLGSVLVDPAHRQDARALLAITERKEGLKIYFYEPNPGELYAISHAASELSLPAGKSTQHQELQKALLFTGVAKGSGRFRTEDPAQRAANKMIARAYTHKKPHPAHGGLRLQQHEGRYVLDVSSAFSFHGASDASLDHMARFYANILKQADEPVTRVGVIPAEAAGSAALCIEAAPYLQDLARRIESHLDE